MILALIMAQAGSLNLNVEPMVCLQNGAYVRADRRRAFELNCGTNMTCTQIGGRITISSSGGGGGGGKVGEAYAADASITAQVANVAYSADAGYYAVEFIVNPTDCSAGQYATAIDANGNLTCAQVAYSQVSGAPTLYNQTVEDEATPLTQRSTINFTGSGVTCADTGGKTVCTVSGGGGGGAEPGGTIDSIQFRNDAGTFSGATYADIGPAGTLRLGVVSSTPTAPSEGVQIYAVTKAGRRLPNWQGPSGLDTPFQPGLFANNVRMWYPSTGTTIGAMSMGATVSATASHPTIATTNLLTSISRFQFATSTTAGNSSGVRANADQIWRGNAAGLGGWYFAARCIPNLTTANGRAFFGAQDATAVIGNVNPSTLLDTFYFGFDSTQTTVRFCTNDNTGSATCTDLGANFPVNLSSDIYEFRVFAKPNDSEIFYYAERLGTGATVSGSVTTDLPRNTVLLAPQVWVNNGTDASANQVQCSRVYIESDL